MSGGETARLTRANSYTTDPHALVWALGGHSAKSGPRAGKIFQETDRGRAHIAVSVVVLLELMILREKGKLAEPVVDRVRDEIAHSSNYSVLDVTPDVVGHAAACPQLRDPLDRLIAAQALSLDYPVLTKDEDFARVPGLETVW